MLVIEMESGQVMKFELDEENAPITCANIKKLANENFYEGIIFHRIIKDFMIQGGDPTGTGMGGSKDEIKGEFKSNGVNNTHKHKRGTISMARTQIKDSASSQFFICHVDTPFLDGEYAAFGDMVEGFDVLDEIANRKTGFNDKPIVPPVIKRVYIED
ncbi:MAG: peptidylprolyl isomerase [Erysipelotrichaceae bacterium]|nr:peptidylprolyl isomerase [Erysipelotrichaceae bacterium]